jgi:hypothetical protein
MQHPQAPLHHVCQHQRVSLLANDEQMKSDYNANQPIELFFDQIEDSVVAPTTPPSGHLHCLPTRVPNWPVPGQVQSVET